MSADGRGTGAQGTAGRRWESAVVVFDSACGACGDVAATTAAVLGVPVRVRSCRDPHLADEFPALRGRLGRSPCRRPWLLLRAADGRVAVRSGPRMWLAAARLVPVRRWPAAVRLGARVAWLTARRPGRSRRPA